MGCPSGLVNGGLGWQPKLNAEKYSKDALLTDLDLDAVDQKYAWPTVISDRLRVIS